MPDKLNHLNHPNSPGVYLMKDDQNRIIYVGKAKNIRKRIGSYFRPDPALPLKTRLMMSRVSRIDSISTLSEKEALLLESSLIKKHRPRYNIVLRHDKQYILFRVDRSQNYPALELTRKAKKRRRHVLRTVHFRSFCQADPSDYQQAFPAQEMQPQKIQKQGKAMPAVSYPEMPGPLLPGC